jgi:U4/U6 small nuclear ribonucleoprotein PRP31
MTEIRKAQNRVAFGKEEREVGYGTGEGTKGLGMLGQENLGRIRAAQIDQRTKAKLSKANKGWGAATPVGGTASSLRGFGQGAGNASVLRAQGLRAAGVGASAGTASTIAFTPVQGLELADPKALAELNRKRKAEEDRWFQSGTFTQVGQSSASSAANGGFKVPELPRKRTDTGEGKMGPPPPPLKR